MSEERKFEKNMERLEKIISILDKGEISLEESLKLYKEGLECSVFCKNELDKAQHEIAIWEKNNSMENGAFTSYSEDSFF